MRIAHWSSEFIYMNGFWFPVSLRYCWMLFYQMARCFPFFLFSKDVFYEWIEIEMMFTGKWNIMVTISSCERRRSLFNRRRKGTFLCEEPERGRIFWIISSSSFWGTSLSPCSPQLKLYFLNAELLYGLEYFLSLLKLNMEWFMKGNSNTNTNANRVESDAYISFYCSYSSFVTIHSLILSFIC